MRSAAFSDIDSSTEGRRLPAFAIVLAGGSGTRLWPATGPSRPKQFLPWLGGRSLFQRTLDRVRPLFAPSRILVVCGAAHLGQVRAQAPSLPRGQILVEGTGRNTAASIALAALWIRRRTSDAVMLVMPSDHQISRPAEFRRLVGHGIRVIRRHGGFLTLGISPGGPDTGYGYIEPSPTRVAPGVWTVRRFVEKPDAVTARRLIRRQALWNSGIFIWRTGDLLEALTRYRPKVLAPLETWVGRSRSRTWSVPASVLDRVESVPIDHAVLERSPRVLVMPSAFGWSDIGNWDSFGGSLRRDGGGNASVGDLLALDSFRCLGVNEGGLTVFVGVRDILAVRSGDRLLVCHRASAQRVREIAARLEARRRPGSGTGRP